MKKLLTIFILLAVLLAACGSQGQAAAGNTERTGGAPAFAGNSPDLYGEVKSISGSEITLALIELPQRRFGGEAGPRSGGNNGSGGTAGADANGAPGGGNSPEGSGRRDGGNRTEGGDRPSSDNRPNGGNRQEGSTRPDGGNTPRGNNGFNGGADMQRNYTGETVTLKIPENTPISTFERGNGGTEEKKLTLGDIKAGDLLQVWYKKEPADSKDIESIRLMRIPAPANQDASGQGAT